MKHLPIAALNRFKHKVKTRQTDKQSAHLLQGARSEHPLVLLMVHLFAEEDVTADRSWKYPGQLGRICQLSSNLQRSGVVGQLPQDCAQQRGLSTSNSVFEKKKKPGKRGFLFGQLCSPATDHEKNKHTQGELA